VPVGGRQKGRIEPDGNKTELSAPGNRHASPSTRSVVSQALLHGPGSVGTKIFYSLNRKGTPDMDSAKSRKIVVATGMAAVIGIGVVAFTLIHHPTSTAQVRPSLAIVPPTRDVPAAAAPIPDAPAAAASAVEPKPARSPHLAEADSSAVEATGTGTRTRSTANASEHSPTEAVTSSSPTDDQRMGTSTEPAASDSQITTDVKSQLAGDSLSKDVNIGVSTTDGVVTLTGTLANQTTIDHVKDVAGRVKDVKSVDTSALVLASL
jgi:BON domain